MNSTSPGPRIHTSDTAEEAPHHCLGAHLAKLEMKALFRAMLTRLGGVRTSGTAVLVDSNFDNRVGALPFTFGRNHPNGPR
ncbi:cytochrome P450 [Streptomyces pratensis]|nr:cytochrome P450 [Streptomyces pratensis]